MEKHALLVEVGGKKKVFPWTSGNKAIEWAAREALRQMRWSFSITDSISARTTRYDVKVEPEDMR